MATKRDFPYVWPTWVTGLISGDRQCGYAPWLKAHFEDLEKEKRSGDLTGWTVRHNQLLKKRADELRADGYEVFLEDQNKFTLQGRAGKVGGKPDIVAIKGDDYVVVDAKGGKQRDSDIIQVQMYMLFLPLTHDRCKGQKVRGELEYEDGPVLVDTVPKKIEAVIYDALRDVCGDQPLPKVPSPRECAFCDITKKDCPARMEKGADRTVKSERF